MERTNEMWLEQLQDENSHQAKALAELYQFLKRGILAYLNTRQDLNHLVRTELAQMSEDFAQDVLLKIRTNLGSFQGKSNFTTWAAKIAAKHVITELRQAKKVARRPSRSCWCLDTRDTTIGGNQSSICPGVRDVTLVDTGF
jgi:RNA polymerase sigma factor (sigma-70 family)